MNKNLEPPEERLVEDASSEIEDLLEKLQLENTRGNCLKLLARIEVVARSAKHSLGLRVTEDPVRYIPVRGRRRAH